MNVANKEERILNFLVEKVLVLKQCSKKSMLLLILGKLEIMSLVAVVAGDGENIFIFGLLEIFLKRF